MGYTAGVSQVLLLVTSEMKSLAAEDLRNSCNLVRTMERKILSMTRENDERLAIAEIIVLLKVYGIIKVCKAKAPPISPYTP